MKKLPLMSARAAHVYLWLLNVMAQTGKNRILANRGRIGEGVGINRLETVGNALAELRSIGLIRYRTKSRIKDGKYAGKFYEILMRRHTLSVTLGNENSLHRHTPSVTLEKESPCTDTQKVCVVSLKERSDGHSAKAPCPPQRIMKPLNDPELLRRLAREGQSNG